MISVAIDGPAGAGKSTLARQLARDLGYIYVDTGAMYRAVGLYALRAGADPADQAAVNALLPGIRLRLAVLDGEQHIYLNEEDVSGLIRTEQVGMAASAVGANPAVRAFLLDLQRDMARTGNVLMDGRDIGTVILPDATVKIFLTASPEARARRRWLEYQAAGRPDSYEAVLADVMQRDEQDSGRAAAHFCHGPGPEPGRHEADHQRACGGIIMLYPVIIAGAWLIWHILFRIQVIGKENLKKIQTPGFILAPTHISAIDPVFIAIARFWGKRMVVFGKKELFEINPVVTWFLGQCGCVMVRGTKDEMETLNNTIEECKKGRGLLLFPEGTREKEGKLLPPKSGLFVVAAGAGTDVIPCRVLYDTPDGRMKLFCRVRVVFGEPMPAAQFKMESRRDIKTLKANKQALTAAWIDLGNRYAFEGAAHA